MAKARKPDPGAAERMRKMRARRKADRTATAEALVAMQLAGPQLPLPGIAAPTAAPLPTRMAELRDQMLARYPSPVLQWAEIISRPVQLLADQLGCSRLEAHQEQEKARKELAAYLHQKMPLAIQNDGPPIAPVHLHIGAAPAGGAGGDQVLDIQVIQPLSGDDQA